MAKKLVWKKNPLKIPWVSFVHPFIEENFSTPRNSLGKEGLVLHHLEWSSAQPRKFQHFSPCLFIDSIIKLVRSAPVIPQGENTRVISY